MTPADFHKWLADPHRRPLLMGVLNVTPDSFSDGGRFIDPQAAIAQAKRLLAAGASLIDVGGESTRPGADPVSADEQIRRVVPVIRAIAGERCVISIDTSDAMVARAALEAGAGMINDITAGQGDPGMFALAADRAVPIALMHMQGTPRTMQASPSYTDVVAEVAAYLRGRADVARAAGMRHDRILIDVGIGFGKTTEHNLSLLRHHARFRELDFPILLGTSRKGFIGKVTGTSDPADRVFGTAATVAWGITNGADIVRVHDVEPMRQVTAMIEAIRTAK